MFNTLYAREIRTAENTLLTERFEGYSAHVENLSFFRYILSDANQKVIGELSFTVDVADGNREFDCTSSMPGWWSPPQSNCRAIAGKYEAGGNQRLSTTRNVVTFVAYTDDGRFLAQVRSYVTPAGNRVNSAGFFSINGGLMETDDILNNLAREMAEELLTIAQYDFLRIDIDTLTLKVGDVYDAEAGRTNHVFRISKSYETLLDYVDDNVATIILNPEGLARAALWREDLDAIIAEGRLTGISALIFEKFPELLPPARPRAATDD